MFVFKLQVTVSHILVGMWSFGLIKQRSKCYSSTVISIIKKIFKAYSSSQDHFLSEMRIGDYSETLIWKRRCPSAAARHCACFTDLLIILWNNFCTSFHVYNLNRIDFVQLFGAIGENAHNFCQSGLTSKRWAWNYQLLS